MNKTVKILKRTEKKLAKNLNKDFGGLKSWKFLGDMHNGELTIVVTAKEKK